MRRPLGILAAGSLAGILVAAMAACSGALAGNLSLPDGMDLHASARASVNASTKINAILDGPVTEARIAALSALGAVKDVIPELNAVVVQGKSLTPASLLALPFVTAANFDAERSTGPVIPISADSMADGMSTWDLDAVDVTDPAFPGRTVAQDGTGVYVAVLDTGLVDGWRRYFPEARIATQYATAFGGGGGENGNVSEPANKWDHDTDSHGTHVTSSILGYSRFGVAVNGVAPGATVIPVKVLNNNGSGWSSAIARGIVYATNIKMRFLGGAPLVINMSLGGSGLDAVEKAAIDYAIGNGVIVVASAGNEGLAGMGYPGAYAPVISVAASGWTGEWKAPLWWKGNVPDPTSPADFYIADFSSRALAGQDLDISAPGSWVVGPYQTNGQTSYYYLGGTSMASPHVAGAVALLCQKKRALTAASAEALLESTAMPLAAGTRMVTEPSGLVTAVSWGDDATGSGLIDIPAALAALP